MFERPRYVNDSSLTLLDADQIILSRVPRFRIDSLAALARQMSFTPHEVRLAQITAAEELLHTLEATKAYPIEYIVFRITGFHRKSADQNLLTGLAIQHDLGLLIEKVSDTLDLNAGSHSEPVLSIDDVTEKFNVTSKTIQRWRRRGLPARRFIYPDGKKRVGFLLSSVERFVQLHHDQVERGANFSQVSDEEKAGIVRRARRLATMCHCCVNEISRRIARKLNRSPLTVLHTIRKHDADNPQDAVFARAPEPIDESARLRILKAHRHGVTMKTLAKRVCRPRSAIYRVIVEERIARLNRRKVRFIDDTIYHGDDAEVAIRAMVAAEDIAHVSEPEAARIPRDLPAYLQELYRTPLLTPAKERALFLKFNFHKFQFVQARRRLDPQFARAKDLNILEGHLRKATETKNAIVRANLRLVVSVARKHVRSNVSLMELVSDGNMTLLRAVESFDVHKGNRFSTYATLALMKGFARSVPMLQSRSKHARVESLAVDIADASSERSSEMVTQRDEVRQLLRRLDSRERAVVEAHFGLGQGEAMTYDALAERMGLSKQRIRQIEQRAIEKLRAHTS